MTSLRKWDILSGNGQIFAKVSALWTTRHVTTTQLCLCSVKAATDNTYMDESGYVPKKLSLQKQAVGWIWLIGYSLLRAVLKDMEMT